MDRHDLVDRALRLFNTHQRRFVARRAGVCERVASGALAAPAVDRRRLVAELYLRGSGLEIGALNGPLALPEGAHARYVDRLDLAELRAHYPGLELVPVDIVDDGERLASIAAASQDFIVANHFLEHCQDPIGTLQHLAAKLRPDGILYLAVPDADQTFDAGRPSTTFDHLVTDHAQGPASSRHAHFQEWAALVEDGDARSTAARVRQLEDMDYSIHFHVWRLPDLLELFARTIAEHDVPLRIELVTRNGIEVICVLRRVDRAGAR
ncbi:MAG TPA: methyltransferase domain-containing protein [Thermoleophilia bacterium]|nr:methyltransferase domain-containing protein [Thermoleophilia bacterium]